MTSQRPFTFDVTLPGGIPTRFDGRVVGVIDVDPEDSAILSAFRGADGEPRLGAAARGRVHDEVRREVLRFGLIQELTGATHITERTDRIRAAGRDQVDALAGVSERSTHSFPCFLSLIGGAGVQVGAEQVVQEHVAGGFIVGVVPGDRAR